MAKISQGLRTWFMIHFIVDVIFAIPLIFFPAWLLGLFGYSETQFITSRLLGAGLLGIGGASYLTYKKSKESYHTLLNLKIIWSISAILVLLYSLFLGAPRSIWFIIIAFIIFSVAWIYYKNKIST